MSFSGYGFSVGTNFHGLNELTFVPLIEGVKQGACLGVYRKFKVSKRTVFQVELNFFQSGGEITGQEQVMDDLQVHFRQKIKSITSQIPVLFRYKLASFFQFELGGYISSVLLANSFADAVIVGEILGVPIHQNFHVRHDMFSKIHTDFFNSQSQYDYQLNRYVIGGLLGVELRLTNRIGLGLRYGFDLSPFSNNAFYIPDYQVPFLPQEDLKQYKDTAVKGFSSIIRMTYQF